MPSPPNAAPYETLHGLQPTDVICAQTRAANKHPGNRRYVELIEKHYKLYLAAVNNKDKAMVSQRVISEVQETGARFMKYNPVTQTWDEMPKRAAHEKVGQALRARQRPRRAVAPKQIMAVAEGPRNQHPLFQDASHNCHNNKAVEPEQNGQERRTSLLQQNSLLSTIMTVKSPPSNAVSQTRSHCVHTTTAARPPARMKIMPRSCRLERELSLLPIERMQSTNTNCRDDSSSVACDDESIFSTVSVPCCAAKQQSETTEPAPVPSHRGEKEAEPLESLNRQRSSELLLDQLVATWKHMSSSSTTAPQAGQQEDEAPQEQQRRFSSMSYPPFENKQQAPPQRKRGSSASAAPPVFKRGGSLLGPLSLLRCFSDISAFSLVDTTTTTEPELDQHQAIETTTTTSFLTGNYDQCGRNEATTMDAFHTNTTT